MVEGARLEFVCGASHRGFESLPLRKLLFGVNAVTKFTVAVFDNSCLVSGGVRAVNSARSGRKQR